MPRVKGSLLLEEPVPDRSNTVEHLFAQNAVRRRFAQCSITLAGAKAHAALAGVFLFRDVTLKDRRAEMPPFVVILVIFLRGHPPTPPPPWESLESGDSKNREKPVMPGYQFP